MSMVGTRVGNIRVVEILGKGGMGEVYVGFDETLHRKVALKAIRNRQRLSADAKDRFLREARILSRLEHPDICRIYDYVVHGDREFLVLELIDGESLAQALKRDLPAQRKIDIAIRIAGVLAAAHAANIVHRDLKPDNVMITADGGVKVLDFGLARSDVEDPATVDSASITPPVDVDPATTDRETDPAATVELHADETIVTPDDGTGYDPDATVLRTSPGSLMGTPVFMSPEQAKGEPASTASDMYSFGLVLQTLFTGRLPYESGLDFATLVRKAAAGETLPVSGVGGDIAALIGRLKALAPASRATAVEAAQRLEWIRDKSKRRARRMLAAAVLIVAALAGIKYTVDLRRERSIAVEARQTAEQRREQAEDLISYMLGDLRGKLTEVGRLEILDDVGDKALDYFASVPEEELSDTELSKRATALYQIGEVRIDQGNLEAAMTAFQESMGLARGLVERDPENLDWLQNLGNCHFWIANVHWSQGELSEALEAFEKSRDIMARLAESDPSNRDWQMELAYGEGNVGWMYRSRGELEPAREHLGKRLAILEQVVSTAPEALDLQLELATSHVMSGTVEEELGDLDGALTHFRTNLAILEDLVAKDPNNADWQQELVVARSYAGTAHEHRGEIGAALEQYRAYLTVAKKMAAEDPSNMLSQDILATGHNNIGRALAAEGDSTRGISHLREALDIFDRLTAKDSTNSRWLLKQAGIRTEIGSALAAIGVLDDAKVHADAARDLLEDLAASEPEDTNTHQFLSDCYFLLGSLAAKTNRAGQAQAAWQRALEVIEPFARDSRDGTMLAPWAAALLMLGRTEEARPIVDTLREQGFVDPRLTGFLD